MPRKALISDLTWRSLEMQKAAYKDIPIYLAPGEIENMLRHTTRKEDNHIYVMSLGVIADNQEDFVNFLELMKKRKAILHVTEDENGFSCDVRHWKHSDAIKAWKEARKNGVTKIGGRISADIRLRESKEACDKIKDRWPMPNSTWPTFVLLKEAGISLNTAKKFLGRRPLEQANYQAAQKRKDKRDAKRI